MNSSKSIRWERQPAVGALARADSSATWDRLNAERGDLPFLSAGAVRNALDVFGEGGEQLLTGRQGSETVAMFVLAPAGSMRWQTFQPSQLPLGTWVARADQALDDLAASLVHGPLGMCLVLSLTQIDSRFVPRGDDSPTLRHGDYIETGWVDIQGSFDEYWAARGKNLRQNMRKQRNKLAAEGVTTRMRVLCQAAEMQPALDRYALLEGAGWKAGEGTAIDAGHPQARFYRRLFEEAAACGEAVVYEYLFDERTVAMNLCLLRGGQLIVLKTAYDESIKSLSPAFMLREEELQSFFAGTEVRRVEYYGRLMDWHTKLTHDKRALYHLTCYRWAWVKQLAARHRAAPADPGKVADMVSGDAAVPAAVAVTAASEQRT